MLIPVQLHRRPTDGLVRYRCTEIDIRYGQTRRSCIIAARLIWHEEKRKKKKRERGRGKEGGRGENITCTPLWHLTQRDRYSVERLTVKSTDLCSNKFLVFDFRNDFLRVDLVRRKFSAATKIQACFTVWTQREEAEAIAYVVRDRSAI